VADGDKEQLPKRRIRHARQTAAALERVLCDPTPANIAALHELHAHHLRELGDEAGAARAVERAKNARRLAAPRYSSPSVAARLRTVSDAPGKGVGEHVAGRGRKRNVGEDGSPDADAPGKESRAQAGRAIQAKHAEAGLQRADAGLRRAVEASERTDAYTARETAGHERSTAARRRLRAAEARGAASALRPPLGEREDAGDERDRVADERERVADERERTADERDGRADVRDKIADKRDRVADQRERTADGRDKARKKGR
jgi:hypothetical protein